MNRGFTRGLIIGSIIGAAASMMMEPGMMNNRNRRKMMRNGKNFVRNSGNFISDMMSMIRQY